MSKRTIVALVAFIAAGCTNGGTSSPPASSRAAFSVQGGAADRGGSAQVALRSGPGAGAIATLVAEMDYDTSRLRMKSCTVDATSAAGKTLHVAEPSPGKIRAVLAGTLEPLPDESDMLVCNFSVSADAPAGATTVRVHGEVADTTFEDRPFSTEGTVVVGR